MGYVPGSVAQVWPNVKLSVPVTTAPGTFYSAGDLIYAIRLDSLHLPPYNVAH